MTLRWTFTRGGSQAPVEGNAAVERALYRGAGGKLGKPFDIDIEWNATDGYLRGKDSDEDKTWVAKEIARGVRLMIDRRGWCDEGEC